MQIINWDILKEKLIQCYNENRSYIREFKMRNGNIIEVSKYSHTDFKIKIINSDNVILESPSVNGPIECYDTIKSLIVS